MKLTKSQTFAVWIGCLTTIVPAICIAEFLPGTNRLPFWGWVCIPAVGGLVAGFISTSNRRIAASVAIAIACTGAVAGIVGYIWMRNVLFDSATYLKLELILGAMLGATPGFLAYRFLIGKNPSPNGSLDGASGNVSKRAST